MAGSTNSTTDTQSSSGKQDKGSVQYVGIADVRKISKSDWSHAGVDHEQVVWDASNQHTVPVADLSAEALEYLKTDSGFKIVEPKA